MQHPTKTPPLTPAQIRRRVNDFDQQIRQGLEDGTVRTVMKVLGPSLKELLILQRGSAEERAAFPSWAFLYNFIQAWNVRRNELDFIDRQMDEMAAFDTRTEAAAAATAAPSHYARAGPPPATVIPVPTMPLLRPPPSHAVPPPPHAVPPPRPPSQRRVPPRPLTKANPDQLAAAVAAKGIPSAAPMASSSRKQLTPPPATRSHPPVSTAPAALPSAPTRYVRQPSPEPPKRPVKLIGVVLDERKKVRQFDGERSDEEDSEDGFHDLPCPRCERANRNCEKNPKGSACLGCRRGKCKCTFSKEPKEPKELKEVKVKVRAPAKEKEKQPKEGGKKRKAGNDLKEPAARPQTTGEVKKAIMKTPKGQAAPKSREYVEESDVEMEGPEDDEEEDEEEEPVRKPKRQRLRTYADAHTTEARLQRLEAQVSGLADTARQSTQVFGRLEGLKTKVGRLTGSLETFLDRIQIDDRLRLIPAERRLTARDLDVEVPPETGHYYDPHKVDTDLEDDEDDEEHGTHTDGDDEQSRFPTPLTRSVATTSEDAEDIRMVDPPSPTPVAEPIDPEAASMPPPLPPSINLIPATPQNSQEQANGAGPSLVEPPPPAMPMATNSPPPPLTPAPEPAPSPPSVPPATVMAAPTNLPTGPPQPAPIRRGRSRTPLPPHAGPSNQPNPAYLAPAVGLLTRSRSRSQSHSPA